MIWLQMFLILTLVAVFCVSGIKMQEAGVTVQPLVGVWFTGLGMALVWIGSW